MDARQKAVMEKQIETVIRNLEHNNMRGYYVPSRKDVPAQVEALLHEGDTVAVGGSMSLNQSGVMDLLRSGRYRFLDRSAPVSCSAKLPIYGFFTAAFFPKHGGLVMIALYFGGIAERVQKAAGNVAIYTVGAGVFDGAEGANGSVAEQEWVAPARPVKVVSSQVIEKSGVNLFKADVVVAAGRGFAEESQLSLANDLCDKLGAGLACSRPLTEGVNWLPTERYVGVSGLMLTPKVYIAAGISGQMQHMVGCNRSGAIFAINKDKNAPIFKQCDFGIVGDLNEILPAITAAL